MQIHSFPFLILTAVTFLVYWFFCQRSLKLQNLLLLLVSYVFYATWDPVCLLLLLATSLSVYIGSLYISTSSKANQLFWGNRDRGWWVSAVIITINLVILGFFKYYNFFVDSFCSVFNIQKSLTLHIVLPVGISFYTFSAISYIVDVYKGKTKATSDIISCLLYISFFPAILSGPIHKSTEQLPQYLKKRVFDYTLITEGMRMILWGSFIKLCVADRIGVYVDEIYSSYAIHNGTTILLASLFYTFQIYADFSGYSLVAIGLGRLFGIKLQTNFNLPYFSKTITEFWSKWHMSLTNWFKLYLYIPLGGNRVNKCRWVFNILIVFLLSGLWHGAAYTFILWGLIHGVAQVLEKLIYGNKIKTIEGSPYVLNVFRTILTFSIVNFAWVFFRVPSFGDSVHIISKIFTQQDPANLYIGTINNSNIFIYNCILLSILIFKDLIVQFFPKVIVVWNKKRLIRWISYYVLLLLIIMFGMNSSENFIYYQF